MRVLIIGVGGVGAMAAWRLASTGHEVVAFEQFEIDHDRGSSYGDSRIVRRVYADSLYTDLMAASYRLWDMLQTEFPAEELIRRGGGLFFGPANHPVMQQATEALVGSGVDFEYLTARQAEARFPAFRFQLHEAALFEPSMGFARSSHCVLAALHLAEKFGARVHTNTQVSRIEPTPCGVRILTKDGVAHEGDRLIVTAGSWTGSLLAQHGTSVRLKVTRQTYVHLAPDSEQFTHQHFPVWIDSESNYYGFPRIGTIPGVKIARHVQGEVTEPHAVKREVSEEDIAELLIYSRTRFPDLGTQRTYAKVCLYTNTPDEDFMIDAVPGFPHTYFVGGLSGHGFKFTPLLGEILCQMATTGTTEYDLERFRLGRFR